MWLLLAFFLVIPQQRGGNLLLHFSPFIGSHDEMLSSSCFLPCLSARLKRRRKIRCAKAHGFHRPRKNPVSLSARSTRAAEKSVLLKGTASQAAEKIGFHSAMGYRIGYFA